MHRIVAIDSFDTPIARPIKPKKNIRNPFNQPNQYADHEQHMNQKSVDKRSGTYSLELNGGVQHAQLLLLTSADNPLIRIPDTNEGWLRDKVPSGKSKRITGVSAETRRIGHESRDPKLNPPRKIQIIWEKKVRYRLAYKEEPNTKLNLSYQYAGSIEYRRLCINVRDCYVKKDSDDAANPKYTNKPRYIWCPPGILLSDVKDNGDDVKSMTAIGCTCRDMVFRGSLEARYGCKHIIAFNIARNKEGYLL